MQAPLVGASDDEPLLSPAFHHLDEPCDAKATDAQFLLLTS
jgi:hypothetical protein